MIAIRLLTIAATALVGMHAAFVAEGAPKAAATKPNETAETISVRMATPETKPVPAEKSPPTETKAPPAPKTDLSPLADAIEHAADPLTAISGFARGYAIDPNSVVLHRAYMKRMLRADLPEMAHDSARMVATLAPDDTQAWTVLAHRHIERGRLAEALADLARARSGLKDSPFGLAVAGKVLGEYRRRGQELRLPESLRRAAEGIRRTLAGDKTFSAAFAKAAGAPSTKKITAMAPPAKPDLTDALLSRTSAMIVRDRIRSAAGRLDRETRSLEESIYSSGERPARTVTGQRDPRMYLYSTTGYGVPQTYGPVDVYQSGYPRPYPYPYGYYRYYYPYAFYGSITHGRAFRGMGGGILGSITHGRPFRGMGGYLRLR